MDELTIGEVKVKFALRGSLNPALETAIEDMLIAAVFAVVLGVGRKVESVNTQWVRLYEMRGNANG